jgi:amino acid permease
MNMGPDATSKELGSPIKAVVVSMLFCFVCCGAAAVAFIAMARYLSAHHAGFWAMMATTVVYCVVILALALSTARIARRLMKATLSTAAKRYARRFTAAMSLYALALVVAIGAYIRIQPTGVLAYALAIAPAIPLVAAIVIIGLYLREETDEFERAVQVESALWATGGMLAIATVWGFLETFRLAPNVPTWAVFPIWAVLLGPAQIIARWRYR